MRDGDPPRRTDHLHNRRMGAPKVRPNPRRRTTAPSRPQNGTSARKNRPLTTRPLPCGPGTTAAFARMLNAPPPRYPSKAPHGANTIHGHSPGDEQGTKPAPTSIRVSRTNRPGARQWQTSGGGSAVSRINPTTSEQRNVTEKKSQPRTVLCGRAGAGRPPPFAYVCVHA